MLKSKTFLRGHPYGSPKRSEVILKCGSFESDVDKLNFEFRFIGTGLSPKGGNSSFNLIGTGILPKESNPPRKTADLAQG